MVATAMDSPGVSCCLTQRVLVECRTLVIPATVRGVTLCHDPSWGGGSPLPWDSWLHLGNSFHLVSSQFLHFVKLNSWLGLSSTGLAVAAQGRGLGIRREPGSQAQAPRTWQATVGRAGTGQRKQPEQVSRRG